MFLLASATHHIRLQVLASSSSAAPFLQLFSLGTWGKCHLRVACPVGSASLPLLQESCQCIRKHLSIFPESTTWIGTLFICELGHFSLSRLWVHLGMPQAEILYQDTLFSPPSSLSFPTCSRLAPGVSSVTVPACSTAPVSLTVGLFPSVFSSAFSNFFLSSHSEILFKPHCLAAKGWAKLKGQ